MSVEARVQQTLRLLGLRHAARILPEAVKAVQDEKLSNDEFLERLLDEELSKREESRIERGIKRAQFPSQKTLSQYDFSFPKEINKQEILGLAQFEWLRQGRNIVFLGGPGVGKTHLSIALGVEVIKQGYETRFISSATVIELINRALMNDKATGSDAATRKFLKLLVKPDLLILDDCVYSTAESEVVGIVFEVIRTRSDANKSMILTAHNSLNDRHLFVDQRTTEVAKLLEGATIIAIKGESFRTKRSAS